MFQIFEWAQCTHAYVFAVNIYSALFFKGGGEGYVGTLPLAEGRLGGPAPQTPPHDEWNNN